MTDYIFYSVAILVCILLFLYLKFEYVLTHHRWVFVCFFLLPLSFFYELYFYLRNRIVMHLHSAPTQHKKRVKEIQENVTRWGKEGGGKLMCTARPSFLTVSMKYSAYKDTHWKVPINLHDILEIDIEQKKCKLEPLVTMGQISASLNPLGWTLPVLPELDDLTVGGLIMGVGIETSSHIYGLFQHTCISYDVITSDGSLVHCSEDCNQELFFAIPWSYGTIGFLVAVEIRIIPAKPFVEIQYLPFNEIDCFVDRFKIESDKQENDFVEGIIFSKTAGVIMTGKFCDFPKQENLINRIGKFWKPWFFTHVRKFLSNGTGIEYVPLRDYFHRHTKSLFWEMQDIIPFGNNPIFRYTCGWMVPPKISLLKLTQTNTTKRLYDQKHVTQDILLPLESLKQTLTVFDEEFKVYPLWVCPFKLPYNPGLVHPNEHKTVMYVDVGAYGVPKIKDFDARKALRSVEAFTRDVNGFQMMYADTRMAREEFREMFDHQLYDRMRNELRCENAFPEIYDKVVMRRLRELYRNSCISLPHRQAYTSLSNSHTTDYAYEISSANVRIGKGVTREVGKDLVNRGVKRVLLFTDKNLMQHLPFSATEQSLRAENVEFDVFSEVRVEPTDRSMKAAIHRAQLGQYDGFLAVGGGSVMDTAKVARLFNTYRDRQLEDFIPTPLGLGEKVSRPLKPLICIPTTSGTGSEVSSSAIFDLTAENVKTCISDSSLCPTLAIVDAMNTFSMPRSVATYTGLDVLCQALEAYTANPYTMRYPRPSNPSQRPGDQGSSPISDLAVVHALRLIEMYFLRSVESSEDTQAKSQMSLATVIKGIGFGRAGVHLCHALSYAISCQTKDYTVEGYPKEFSIIPHGLSVIITAPAVFSEIGYVLPQRCIQLAQLLGAKTGSVVPMDAGRYLADQLCSYMKRLGVPNGLSALGFTEEDIPDLVEKTLPQERLTSLSPIPVCETLLEGILTKSLTIYH